MTDKVTNTKEDPYTNKATLEQMKVMYTAATNDTERAEVVNILVEQLGKSKSSVIGKLGALKVYKAVKRTTKSGGPIIRKWEIVDQIVETSKIKFTDAEADSLAKATKDTLLKLQKRFQELNTRNSDEKSNS